MGRPTIVSAHALTGIGTPDTTPVITADSAEAWVAACLQILDEPASAAALAARARPFVLEHFSWNARLRTLDELLSSAWPVESLDGSSEGCGLRPDTDLSVPVP